MYQYKKGFFFVKEKSQIAPKDENHQVYSLVNIFFDRHCTMLQWSALIDVLDLEGIGGNERVLSFFRSSAVLEFLPSLSRENLARSGRV